MRFRFPLLILCLLNASFASAQRVSFGIKGGLNYSTEITTTHAYIDRTGQPAGTESRRTEGYKAGVKLGAFARIDLNRLLSLAPALLWNEKGFSRDFTYYDRSIPDFLRKRNHVTYHYLSLDIPFQFRLDRPRFSPYLLLGARLETPIGYRQSLRASDVPEEYLPVYDFRRSYYQDHPDVNVGLLTAIGAEKRIGPAWTVFLELEYNPSISNSYKARNLEMRNQLFALNVGLRRQQK
ncbi:MAG: PorT family protein [Cytophagales bacterium]|nr:PorT family protein [Cytophagales bacterium]